MNKIFKTILILLLLSIFSCAQITLNDKVIKSNDKSDSEETAYVSGTEDVPLLSGLTQIKDDVTNFDTMTGNIVISTYSGKMNLAEIKKFYLETMPQLGWILSFSNRTKLSYKRKGDNLEIFLKKEKNESIVKFFISSTI